MTLGTAHIIQGNALALPLPDASVDLVCTSPPYFALRSYQDGGEHYDGQIGSEATPAEFLEALLAATREMVRVLKPSGSIWVNLGDKYSGAMGQTHGNAQSTVIPRSRFGTIPQKSLMGLPWRYAIACIDQLGLILRAEIIWNKPNGLPESVTDRVRRSHEQWFHFVKQPRYFAAVDEIREPQKMTGTRVQGTKRVDAYKTGDREYHGAGYSQMEEFYYNPLGKLPGSVWELPDGLSPIRSILDAVAAGAITPEEGERLWTHLSDSYHTLTKQETAGYGSATATNAATAKPQQETTAKTGHTASPTAYSSEKSHQDSQSTTPAETSPASTPNTSNPSQDAKTFAEPTQNEPSADTDTHSLTHTLRSLLQDSPTKNAASASEKESDDTTSVWRVPSQPLIVPPELGIDHFAAFPFEFPRRIIQGWTPTGICTVCGEGRRPISSQQKDVFHGAGKFRNGNQQVKDGADTVGWAMDEKWRTSTTITGYMCACPTPDAPTRPAVCLDPFGGTGTTALVAKTLGRIGISVDLSADYCRLAEWRTNDPGQIAAALQIEKPEPVSPDQLELFT